MELYIIIVIAVIGLITAITYRKRLGKLILANLTGLMLLFPAQYLLSFFGITITINIFSIIVSAILGIPGVVLIALVQ